MHKAAQLAAKLDHVDVADGMKLIEEWTDSSLFFDVIDEAMCILHSDGSANIIDHVGKGRMTVEVISAGNILKVLEHYRPFAEVFKNRMQ